MVQTIIVASLVSKSANIKRSKPSPRTEGVLTKPDMRKEKRGKKTG